MNWVIVHIVCLVLVDFYPVMQLVGLILLLVWYFSQGRKQTLFVKENYGNVYQKKGWAQPILIAIGCSIGLMILETITCIIIVILLGTLINLDYRLWSSADKDNEKV